MYNTYKRIKVDRQLDGAECGWCRSPLDCHDEAALCRACGQVHHSGCWDNKESCSRAGCKNATAQVFRMGEPVVVEGVDSPGPPSRKPSFDERPESGESAPGATSSLVCGILGICIPPAAPIFGTIAIIKGINARSYISRNPTCHGGNKALAGLILGTVSFLAFLSLIS